MNEKIDVARQEKQIPKELRVRRFGGGMIEKKGPLGITFDILLVAFMVLTMLICIVPMWNVLMKSFSNGTIVVSDNSLYWWPKGTDGGFNFGGYGIMLGNEAVWRGYGNTLIYVVGATLFGFVLNVIGGYTLSRPSIYSRPLAFIIMFTMMFQGGLIPTYMVLNSLGMVGTRWALLIPGCTTGVFMLIMSNAFRDVPESTVEAAQIDGAGHLTIMFRVMLPQAMSLATVTILNTVIIQWNSWYPASIYLSTQRELWPLQLVIRDVINTNRDFLAVPGMVDYNKALLQYCVIIIATLPILIAFPFFLKYIEKGVVLGGVKE